MIVKIHKERVNGTRARLGLEARLEILVNQTSQIMSHLGHFPTNRIIPL